MRFKKGTPKPKSSGRKKGTPNKRTAIANAAIDAAFDDIGGVVTLVRWAKENLTEFYRLWGKRITQQVEHSGPDGQPIEVTEIVVRSRVEARELLRLTDRTAEVE